MKNQTEYGYARIFTQDQNGLSQLETLKNAGILDENIYIDTPGEKTRFQQMKAHLAPGDVLVVKNLHQLGYTYREILDSWLDITKNLRAYVRVLDMPLLDIAADVKKLSGSSVSDLFLQIISYVAEQERLYIRQRQAEGIALAKAQGKRLGRPRIPRPAKFDEIYNKWRAGYIHAEEAMEQLGLKRSTFERFVKEKRKEATRQVS